MNPNLSTGERMRESSAPTNLPAMRGLTAAEVQSRLERFGANAVKEEKPHPSRRFLGYFWKPIPWLLEATIIAQLFLGERLEAAVIAGLLILNAALGFFQEERAQKALALLRQQLHVWARVRRNGQWCDIVAEELVPDDVVHLRQGVVAPADVRIEEGSLLVDQSAITGESAAVLVEANGVVHAGSLVRSGEATGLVTATGSRTLFGRTAELVRAAGPLNRQEHEIVGVVRNLFVLNGALVLVVVGFANWHGMSLAHILPLILTILLASIPVALPATFTLAAALGSLELSRLGVLVTRLSALHDIASMTVLCCDKTGTLTRNEATVSTIWPAGEFSEDELLRAAVMASDPSGQDPVDAAVLAAAARSGPLDNTAARVGFKPFDAATKRAEAVYHEAGGLRRYVKGAPAEIAKLCGAPGSLWDWKAQEIAVHGRRVLAVGSGDTERVRFVGLLGLEDAVREDSRSILQAIGLAGIRVVMVTGDNALTAGAVAEQVGIPFNVCPPEQMRRHLEVATLKHSIFAPVYPEDKFRLVRAFQRAGAVVGMSGDGVNDAPALRQADVGVAVAHATDAAKAAAAIVLTRPGLGDIVPALQTSRRVYQRVITYTLNMLAKKIEIMALLVIGFLLTQHKPLTPLLMVLLIFLNDFLTMAISTDDMTVSAQPNQWCTRRIVLAGTILALCKLLFSLGVFLFGHYALKLDTPHLQSLTFATLVLSTQAGVYLLRERSHLWASSPSPFLMSSTLVGVGLAAFAALSGIFVPAISSALVLGVAAAVVGYFLALDWLKVRLFAHLAVR